MTPDQSAVLTIVTDENANVFSNFFPSVASVAAVIQIESTWRQFAFRFEPRLDDASYGYMQVLSQTARSLGYAGLVYPHMPLPNAPAVAITSTLYDPSVNIHLGMTYLRSGWTTLSHAFGRQPTLAEWYAGYNEGYGAVERGRPDPGYVAAALAVLDHWLAELGETMPASIVRGSP